MAPLAENNNSKSHSSANVAIVDETFHNVSNNDTANIDGPTNARLSFPLERNTPVSENNGNNNNIGIAATTTNSTEKSSSFSNRIDATSSHGNHKSTRYISYNNTTNTNSSMSFFRSNSESSDLFEGGNNNLGYTHYNSYYHSDYDNDRNGGVGTKICGQGVLSKLLKTGSGGNQRNLHLSASDSDLSVRSHSHHHTMKSSLLRPEYTDAFGTQGYYSSIATEKDAPVEDLFSGELIEKYKDFIASNNNSMLNSSTAGSLSRDEKVVAPTIANEILTAATATSSDADNYDIINKNYVIKTNNRTVDVCTTQEENYSPSLSSNNVVETNRIGSTKNGTADINNNLKSSAATVGNSRRSALSFFLPLPSSSSSSSSAPAEAMQEQQQSLPSQVATANAADSSSTKLKIASILSSSIATRKSMGHTSKSTATISPLAESSSEENISKTNDNSKNVRDGDRNLDSNVIVGSLYDYRKLSPSPSEHQQLPKNVQPVPPISREGIYKSSQPIQQQTIAKQKALSSSAAKGRGGSADNNNSNFNLFHPFRTANKWSSTLPAVVEESNSFDSEGNGGGAGGKRSKTGASPRSVPIPAKLIEEGNQSIDKSSNSHSNNHGTFEILNAMKDLIMKQQEALKDLSESNARYRQEIDVYHECMNRMEEENTITMHKVQALVVEKESYEQETIRLKDEVQHLRRASAASSTNQTASSESMVTTNTTKNGAQVNDATTKNDIVPSTSIVMSPSSLLLQFESYVRQSTRACAPTTMDAIMAVDDSVVDTMKQQTADTSSTGIMINNDGNHDTNSNIKLISESKQEQQQVASMSSTRDVGTLQTVSKITGNIKNLATIHYDNNGDDDSDDTEDDELVAIVRSSSSSSLSSCENIDQTWSVIDRHLEQPVNTNNDHKNGSKALSAVLSKTNSNTISKSQEIVGPEDVKGDLRDGNNDNIHPLDSSSFLCHEKQTKKNVNDITTKVEATKDDDAFIVEPSQEVMMIPVPVVIEESRDDVVDQNRYDSSNNHNNGKGNQIVRKLFRSLSANNKRNNNTNNQSTSLPNDSSHDISNSNTTRDGCPDNNNNKQYDDPYGEIHVLGETYRVTTTITNDLSVSSSAELNEFHYNNDNKKIMTAGIISSNTPRYSTTMTTGSTGIAKVTVSDILENVSATTTTTPTDAPVSILPRKGNTVGNNNNNLNDTPTSDNNCNTTSNLAPISCSSSTSSIDTAINDEVASFKLRLGSIQKRRLSRQQQKSSSLLSSSTKRTNNSSPSSFVVHNNINNTRSPVVRFIS